MSGLIKQVYYFRALDLSTDVNEPVTNIHYTIKTVDLQGRH